MRWACAAPHCRGSEQCPSSTVPWTASHRTPAPGCRGTWKSYPICRGRQCSFLFQEKSELTPQLTFLNLLVQFCQISKISMLFMNTLIVFRVRIFTSGVQLPLSPESSISRGVSPHPAFREHNFFFSFANLSSLGDTFLWNNGIYFHHFRKSAPKLDLNRNSEFLVASPQLPVPPHTLTGRCTATRP